MRPRVGDELVWPDGSSWIVVGSETAEEVVSGTPPSRRAEEMSRIAAAMGGSWRELYWKVLVRKKNGSGTKVVDSVEASVAGARLVSRHIEVDQC